MDIAPVDVHDDERVEELFALERAVHAADAPDNPPPLRALSVGMLRHDHPEARVEPVAARVGDRLAGWALVALPTVDNLHIAQVQVWVDPGHRRRGVGTRLIGSLVDRAGELGRRTLVSHATGPVAGGPPRREAGARFLAAHGFDPALPQIHRRVDLSRTDLEAEQRLHAECLPHAAGYELVTWRGPTPDHLAAGVAYLSNRVVTDAPRGDLEVDETTVDAARLHADERNLRDSGMHLVGAAAVHQPSGQVAAVTRVDVRPPGDHGTVWITIADPAHRGHRLGTIVKIDAHRRVRREFPGFRYVSTGNADSNAHMVAINERLGYGPHEAVTLYQRKVS